MSRSASRAKLGASSGRAQKKGRGKNNEPKEEEGPAEIEVPQLEWQILSAEITKELASLEVELVAKKLAEVLSLSHHEENLREAAKLDYFVSGYWFAAREEGFSDAQVSAFITVLHTLLDNIKTKQLSLQNNILAFRTLVAGVGLPPSPDIANPLKCFTMETGMAMLRYLQSSLFQHYSLYEYLFSQEQQEEIISQKLVINTPPDVTTLCPPPLEEAVSIDFYQRCISPPSPEEEQEEVEEQEQSSEGEHTSDAERRMNVTADNLRDVMEKITTVQITNYKDAISQKLKKKEEAMLSRLSKLEKTMS